MTEEARFWIGAICLVTFIAALIFVITVKMIIDALNSEVDDYLPRAMPQMNRPQEYMINSNLPREEFNIDDLGERPKRKLFFSAEGGFRGRRKRKK